MDALEVVRHGMEACDMTSQNPPEHLIIYLLLRDGHTVPILDLDPESLKRACKATLQYGNVPLKHTTKLNAIVDCLGFDGDFGTYKREHWPKLEAFLEKHGMCERVDLFAQSSSPRLGFEHFKNKRRALTDRIFSSGFPQERLPTRAFTGYGFDWNVFDSIEREQRENPPALAHLEPGSEISFQEFMALYDVKPAPPESVAETRAWLWRRRIMLARQHSYMGDHLLDVQHVEPSFPLLYGGSEDDVLTAPGGAHPDFTVLADEDTLEAFGYFRALIDEGVEGWVEIHRYNDNLVILEGPGGTYDLLWRNLRAGTPPKFDGHAFGEEKHFDTWYYYQQGRWDERDTHEAEHHLYRDGRRTHPGTTRMLMEYCVSLGEYQGARVATKPTIGIPFTAADLGDSGELWVSDLITKEQLERFLTATDILEKMSDEDHAMHEAANWECGDKEPAGATYHMAKAYCDWLEAEHGIPVRLITHEEHRLIRPFALGLDGEERYRMLSDMDFPWERFPPRERLPSGLVWSTERFAAPDEDTPEFPPPSGFGGKSRKIWIKAENWPPKAKLSQDATRVTYKGIEFIDAWDVYEWCVHGIIGGRYWQGPMGAHTWGEYKNCRVNFRVVVPKGGAR